jgi:hypothetical protein
VLEIVAATLLTAGSVLLIRALIAADRAFAPADRTPMQAESHASAPPLKRAA